MVAISVITNAIINSIDGIIISSPYYSIKNFPLKERLEARIGLPIYLQNCTTAWTMSEFFSDTSSCEDIKQDITNKIVKKGVSLDAFKLEILPTKQVDATKVKVVGHCQADKFKIVYSRLLHY